MDKELSGDDSFGGQFVAAAKMVLKNEGGVDK